MKDELAFDEAMEKLEKIVDRLENGDVPLEQAIELYKEGMQLSNVCGKKLEQVEKEIELLVEQEGEWVTKPYPEQED